MGSNKKNIKVHSCIDGVDSVEDINATISHSKLKDLGTKRKIYKNTNEIFFLIETDYELSF